MPKKDKEKAGKNKKAKSPFILALVGGIISILFGILTSALYIKVADLMKTNPQLLNVTAEEIVGVPEFFVVFGWIILGVFVVFGILDLVSAILLKKERTMKKGGIMALIVGILGVNIFVIIAGALGLAFSPKKNKA